MILYNNTGAKYNKQCLFDDLRNCDPRQFVWKIECSSEQVSYMDLQIRRGDDGSILTATYRKPSYRPQYLHFASGHPLMTKIAIYQNEAPRGICSTAVVVSTMLKT